MPISESARIDVLRGIAALGVALFHVRVPLWSGWAEIQANSGLYSSSDYLLSWLGIPMRFLGTGVLLFFVISGYCIHSPQAGFITKEPSGAAKAADPEKAMRAFQSSRRVCAGFAEAPDWIRFYIRRFLRIYPPYLMALAVSVVVWAWGGGAGWSRFFASLPMVQNYWPPRGQISTNPSLWSLPVEMELYLVYPMVWCLGRRLGWDWALGVIGCFSLVAQCCAVRTLPWLNGSFPAFWVLWCSGAWVAETRATRGLPEWNRGWTLGLILVVAVSAASELLASTQMVSQWLWGVVGVLALIWAAGPKPAAAKATGAPKDGGLRRLGPLARLGTISYSLYLIHYPIFHLAGRMWQQAFGAKPSSILVPLAAVALVIPLAWLFYRLVELPSHRLARRLGARKT